jgi:hypothetical protein
VRENKNYHKSSFTGIFINTSSSSGATFQEFAQGPLLRVPLTTNIARTDGKHRFIVAA